MALLALFTVFGPTVATAASGGHHLPAVDAGAGSSVSVADLRETDGDGLSSTASSSKHVTRRSRCPTAPTTTPSRSDRSPGPQLVVTQGELVEVTLTNRDVEEGVTLHWHGYDVPVR